MQATISLPGKKSLPFDPMAVRDRQEVSAYRKRDEVVGTGATQEAGAKVIRILAFTLVISVMSATMFNIVLPEIRREFQLSLVQVSWVTSSFLLIYAIGTVIYGKLADLYQLKDLLTFGLLFFAFGSLIGLAAQAYWTVLLGRVLQAVGAAVIPAAAGLIPVRYVPPENRGRALGIAMTGLAVGGAIGPVAASLIVSAAHWRWLFLMPLLTLLALPYYRKYLPDEQERAGSIDWAGAGLLAGAAALLLFAITAKAWAPAAGFVIVLLLFTVRIRTAENPFIRPELFRNPNYAVGLACAFLTTGIGYSLPFLSPQLLTDVQGLAPEWVGLAMVPGAAATAVLGRKAGKLADSKGNPFLFYTASALLLTCLVLLSSYAGAPPVWIALILVFGNVGQSFLMIALSGTISRTLSKEETGVGMGLLAMLNFIAGALSSSLYSAAVDRGADSGWNVIHSFAAAYVYSNIYLLLALLHGVIWILYYYQFGRRVR